MEAPTTSLWHDAVAAEAATRRPSLVASTTTDVAIVGAGYTGLWTAYYLLRQRPELRIVILEREFCGFGASGRNGGWASALLPMSLATVASGHGREAAITLQRVMFDAVDEIGRVTAAEGIDCDFAKGGTVSLARSPAQLRRAEQAVAAARHFGFGGDDLRLLDAAEARHKLNASRVVGGTYTPHCAALHPAKLARGLGRVVERLGATIYESTPVLRIEPGEVHCEQATVSAATVVRATEAFTTQLPDGARQIVPIYSLMVATEPLPQSLFDEIGWRQRETMNDLRHMVIYGQRTADNRIAFGGRGAPYHFASAMHPRFDRDPVVHDSIQRTLVELFPQLKSVRFTHRWGGAVGATRDWWCSVGIDPTTRVAWAGGYLGDGVTTTNLAGRTLADLILANDSNLVRLPWVQHRSRRWEPEPLRWLGINAVSRVPVGADRFEERTGRRSRWREAILRRTLGH